MHKTLWRNINADKYWVLPVIYGIITTALFYTGYGVGDHIEQLPIILRSLDSDYLVNDFFTNASTSSVARWGYSQLLAILASSEQNLPVIFIVITLGSNIAISVITYIFARNLFRASLSGVWASALTMSISTFNLGWSSWIYQTSTVPSTIAIPFAVGSIYYLIKGKIVIAILLVIISFLIHPLFGLEISGLVFATYIVFRLIRKEKLNISAIFPIFLIVTFAFILLVPQFSQQKMDPNEFIYIVAHFRHPHHYIPSTFGLFDYMKAVAFFIAVSIAYYNWLKTSENPSGIMPAIIAGLF